MKRFDPGSPSVRHRWIDRTGVDYNDQAPETVGIELVESSGLLHGEHGWRDSEGDRLDDFGVDEDVEFYDGDQVPLAELLHGKIAPTTNH